MDNAKKFWDWFSTYNHRYLFLTEVDETERNKLLGEILEKLEAYNENLYYEIGGDPNAEKFDFIISAGGIIDEFESVEKLVSQAPNFDKWNIIAFKPPMPEDHTIAIDGKEFDANKIIFIPLTSDETPNTVAIRVCYPEFEESEQNLYINATFFLLDALIGEKSTAIDIDYLEVVQTPKDIAEYPFLHLKDIGDYVLEMKRINKN